MSDLIPALVALGKSMKLFDTEKRAAMMRMWGDQGNQALGLGLAPESAMLGSLVWIIAETEIELAEQFLEFESEHPELAEPPADGDAA